MKRILSVSVGLVTLLLAVMVLSPELQAQTGSISGTVYARFWSRFYLTKRSLYIFTLFKPENNIGFNKNGQITEAIA